MAEGIRTLYRAETPQETARRFELTRRARSRREDLVPLYVMWTSDVRESLARAGVQGVRDVVVASGQNRQIVELGSQSFGDGPFSSADWYAQEALRRSTPRDMGFGPQINTYAFTTLFRDEPWQVQPHWEVFILNTDLTSGEDGNNFVFGATDPRFPYAVQSVTRIDRGFRSADVAREELVRRLLRHEVGHMFGLPRSDRGRNLRQLLGTHCTNVCTMRQGLSVDEWAQHHRQERVARLHFCADCQGDLSVSRRRYVRT